MTFRIRTVLVLRWGVSGRVLQDEDGVDEVLVAVPLADVEEVNGGTGGREVGVD